MLHGVLGQASNWAALLPHIPGGCHGAALHFPLFDNAPRLDSLAALIDYAAGFVASLDTEQVVLAGNSLGGHVALHLALRLPQQVAGLVLAGSSGLLERTFGIVPGLYPSREWIAERVREVFYNPDCISAGLIDEVSQVLHSRGCLRRLVSLFLSARRDDLTGRLGAVRCPALLVWGCEDIVTPPTAARQFHALLPDSELHFIERCGHVPMLEHPYVFSTLLNDWWQRRIADAAEQLCSAA
jgi:pimeloyl-ACP methyl ester carboxylesterase